MMLYCKKAQSINEYAILLVIVVSVLIGMQVYVRRGLHGRLRDASDFVIATMNQRLGSSYLNQYEPAYRISTTNSDHRSSLLQRMFYGGDTGKYILEDRKDVNRTEEIKQVGVENQE